MAIIYVNGNPVNIDDQVDPKVALPEKDPKTSTVIGVIAASLISAAVITAGAIAISNFDDIGAAIETNVTDETDSSADITTLYNGVVSDINKLKEEIEDIQNKIKELENAGNQDEIDELTNELNNKLAKIGDLQNIKNALEIDNNNLESQLNIANSLQENLKNEIDALDSAISQYRLLIANANNKDEKAALEAQLNILLIEKEEYQQRYKSLLSLKKDLQKQIDNLKNANADLSEQNENLKDTCEQLEEQLSDISDIYDQFKVGQASEADWKAKIAKINSLFDEMLRLWEELGQDVGDLDSLKQVVEALNGDINELDAKIAELINQNNELKALIDEYYANSETTAVQPTADTTAGMVQSTAEQIGGVDDENNGEDSQESDPGAVGYDDNDRGDGPGGDNRPNSFGFGTSR